MLRANRVKRGFNSIDVPSTDGKINPLTAMDT
jgi:hypothetical protein